MKYLYIILTLLLMNNSSAQETTTIYLIRHAEKADASPDTELSEAGKARAQKWKGYFSDKNITAVYSTTYKRTTTTAEPLAAANKLTITPYNPSELELKAVADKHTGNSVLIVGHRNTIPKYINKLLAENKYPDIDESEFGYVYIVTIKGSEISSRLEKL
jgi:2,3-bisphosphoglycerate-dependent phosphoglycerate mutase